MGRAAALEFASLGAKVAVVTGHNVKGAEETVRMIQEQTGLTAEIDRILYTWTFMVGSVCSLGLTYLCYTDMEEEDVQLSEDLHDCRWVSADEFGDYISNKRMLEDIDKAELY